MIAIFDYHNYRKRSGRFARKGKKSVMQLAFPDKVPELALSYLEPGDLLFVSTYENWMSWLIMYLTSSEISHVAMYLGNRQIAHMATSGSIAEPIESIYGKNKMILPCHLPFDPNLRMELVNTAKTLANETVPYSWKDVFYRGISILSGRDKFLFRAKFIVDFFTIGLVLDIIPFLLLGYPVFIWLCIVFLLITLANLISPRKDMPSMSQNNVVPFHLFLWARSIGGQCLFNGDT